MQQVQASHQGSRQGLHTMYWWAQPCGLAGLPLKSGTL